MKWWQRSFWQVLIPSILSLLLAIQYGVCTQDDAFISFRYSENWAHGLGWVFNPGERVEGFSNPSWTILFGLILKFGWDPVLSSLMLGYVSLVFYVVCTHRLLKQLQTPTPLIWSTLLLLGVDPSLTLESVQGLESVFYAGLVTGFVTRALYEKTHVKPHLISFFMGALLCITRPDAPLFVGLTYGALLIWNKQWQTTLYPIIGIGIWLLIITSIRWYYYGDVLPNTAYAKVGGLAIERGMQYCWRHITAHPIIWLSLPVTVYSICVIERDKYRCFLLWCTVPYLLYVIAIGGDFKPTSRFLLPLAGLWLPMLMLHFHKKPHQWTIAFGMTLIGLVARAPLFQQSQDWAADRRSNLIARKVVGEWIDQHTPPGTVIAMHSIGVVPYYARRITIDMWGLTDRTIAKTPIEDFGVGMAGHEKRNPEYVFSKAPDLYLPEDGFFQPTRKKQVTELGFPENFEQMYTPVSIKIEGSWLNIWVKTTFMNELQR